MFSKTFGYAIRAAAYVAIHGKEGQRVGLHDISDALDIPHHFLGKVMQDLVRHGVLDSIKGPNGGFFPNAHTAGMPLVEILKITDGSLVFDQCALNIKRCNAEHPCPLHHEFAVCRNGMLLHLSGKTIGQMAAGVEAGEWYLAR
ncbi:MAG TPA: transcriptional regulator [Saprospirales bacterium]|nr:transcriptional regulator [Saprospirales bacterium]